MKIANAKTFGNAPYATVSSITSAIEQHTSNVAHLPSTSGITIGKYLKTVENGNTSWGDIDLDAVKTAMTNDGFTKITSANVSTIVGGMANFGYAGINVVTSAGATYDNTIETVDSTAKFTLAAGNNVTLGLDKSTHTITVNATGNANAEANQNAYSIIAVHSSAGATASNISATSETDTISFVGGSNVKLIPSGKTVTISAQDTTYGAAGANADGLMTSTMFAKLSGITEGATSVVSSDVAGWGYTKITSANVSTIVKDVAYTKSEVDSKLTSVYKYKSSIDTVSSLPDSGMNTGDVYNIVSAGTDSGITVNAGDNVAWNGSAWDVLAGTVDLSNYVQKENGKGLSTEDFTTEMKNKLSAIDANVSAIASTVTTSIAYTKDEINTTLSSYATEANVSTLVQDAMNDAVTSASVTIDSVVTNSSNNPVAGSAIYSALLAKPDVEDFAAVAFTGDYNDLDNQIAIDSEITSSGVNPVVGSAIYSALATKVTSVSGKGLSDENFTSSLKAKLEGISSNAANQNVFKTVIVSSSGGGTTNIVADATEDTFTLVAGAAVSFVADATNDKLTVGVVTDGTVTSNGTNPIAGSAVYSAIQSGLGTKPGYDAFAEVAFTGDYNDLLNKPAIMLPPSQKITFTSANSTNVTWNGNAATFTHTVNCYPIVTIYDSNMEVAYPTVRYLTQSSFTVDFVDKASIVTGTWTCVVTYGHRGE